MANEVFLENAIRDYAHDLFAIHAVRDYEYQVDN